MPNDRPLELPGLSAGGVFRLVGGIFRLAFVAPWPRRNGIAAGRTPGPRRRAPASPCAFGLRALGTTLIAGAWLAIAAPAQAQTPEPEVTITANGDVDEGDAAVFTLSRTGDPAAELTVDVSVREETEVPESRRVPKRLMDPVPDSVTFAPGAAQATLSVPTVDDAIRHVNVRIIVEVESGTGYAPGTDDEARLIVREDDPLTVQFYVRAPDEVEEGDSMQFAVQAVTNGLGGDVEIIIDVENGTAEAGSDYTIFGFPRNFEFEAKRLSVVLGDKPIEYRADGTVYFGGNLAGSTVGIHDDGELENDETLRVRIAPLESDPHIIAQGTTRTITIRDRKPRVKIAPGAGLAREGSDASFTLTREGDATHALTVDVAVGETGDMLAGAVPRSVTFAAGSDTSALSVATVDDAMAEPDSKLTVTIEDDTDRPAAYHTGSPASATVTATDDDGAARAVRISPLTLDMTENGTITYAVALGTQPTGTVTVTPTSSDAGAASVAPASLAFTDSNWAIPQTITITARSDADPDDETVRVSHAVTGADYGDNAVQAPEVTARIRDAGETIVGRGVRIVPTTLDLEEGGSATYSIVLTTRPTGNVQIQVQRQSNEFGAFAYPRTVTFTPSNWNVPQTVVVSSVDDEDALDGTVTLHHTVRGADYAEANVQAPSVTARIRDRDRSSTTSTVRAGLGGSAGEGEDVVFRPLRTGATAEGLDVTVEVSETGQFVAAADEGRRTVTFDAGAGEATLAIPTTDNAFGEPDGTITLEIEGSQDYQARYPTVARATVEDDERAAQRVNLALDAGTVAEDGGSSTVTVTATLDGDPRREATTVSIDVGASTDTATEGTDYATVNALGVTIPSGARSASTRFTLAPTNDTSAEGTERISVRGRTSGLTVGSTSIAITDDETASAVALEASPATVAENGGARTVTVTARIEGAARTSATVVTVEVGDSGDSATEGADYGTVGSVRITVPANASSGTGTFTLTPTNDTSQEGRETISVTGSATGLTVSGTEIAIADDEGKASGAPTITASNAFRVPATLGADLSGITDPDGVTGIETSARYRWRRYHTSVFFGFGLDTELGTGATHTLGPADIRRTLTVEVTFTDDAGNQERRSSGRSPGVKPASRCPAPVLPAGTSELWKGRVIIAKASGANPARGFAASRYGTLDDTTVGIGANSYEIDAVSVAEDGALVFGFTAAVAEADKSGLAVHVCDEAFDLGSAQESTTTFDFTWDSTGLDWSDEAERTLYLSKDVTAPTATSAVVDGRSMVIGFNEPILADALANGAFEVKKTPAGGVEESVDLAGTPWVNGTTVTLTLAVPVSATDTLVRVTYEKPDSGTGNKLADRFGNETASFTRTMIPNTTNAAPTAADATVSAIEETTFVFTSSHFGFMDDDTGMALASVTVETVPATGTGALMLGGRRVDAGAVITRAQLDAGELTYVPPRDAYGTAHASFTFRVGDGRDESARTYTMTIDIEGVNDAVSGAPAITVPNVFRVPAVLSVDLSGIADADGVAGIDDSAIYNWQRFAANGTTLEADGIGTDATYTLIDADVGKKIKVVVQFDDDAGGAEGPLTSAAVPAGADTVTAAAACDAPTLTGGAVLLGGARRLPVAESAIPAFADFLGRPDPATFSVGANSYTIEVLFEKNSSLELILDAALTADDRRTLALHICGAEFLLREASTNRQKRPLWRDANLDWSEHAQRTVYLSHDTVAPTLAQTSVNETSVVMTFSEVLGAAASLANDAFTVTATDETMNETTPTLTGSPAIDGRTVTLTLESAPGASVSALTVSYEKPDPVSDDALVDRFGNEVADFDAQMVGDPAPKLASATVDETTLVLTFSETLAAAANLPTTAFTVERTPEGGQEQEVTVASVAIAGKALTLTLDARIAEADTDVKVSYLAPTSGTGNKLVDVRGTETADFTDEEVENRTDDTAATVASATVDGASLVITFDEELGAAASLVNDPFTVNKTPEGGQEEGVALDAGSAPSIAGKTLTLTLASPVASTDTHVKVSYEAPTMGSANKLVDRAGNEVADFDDRAVTNDTVDPAPTLVSAELTGTSLALTFSAVMDTGAGGIPPSSAFTVSVTAGMGSPTTAMLTGTPSVAGRAVTLTLDAAPASGSSVTITYAKPSGQNDGKLRTARSMTEAEGFGPEDVLLAATGAPAITVPNVFRVPAVLTADLSGIADPDGVTDIDDSATYDWQRFDAAGTTLESAGIGSDATYTLTDADAGKKLRVAVSFADDDGNAEGPLASAAVPAGANTVTAAAPCDAPTLTGGAVLLEGARRIPVRKADVSGIDAFGALGAEIDDATLTVGTNSYTISAVYERGSVLTFNFSSAVAAGDWRTLALHVCGTELRLPDANVLGNASFSWSNANLGWSEHAERTLHLSRDIVAPTVSAASVDGASLVVTFNESLGAAASLVNGPFTVHKTPKDGTEAPVPLDTGSAPVIAGATVTLTLAAAVSHDDSVTVSYEAPTTGSANKLVDRFGNQVADFDDRAVDNDTVPPTPVLRSASLDDTSLTLTFSGALDTSAGGIPTASVFTVSVMPPMGPAADATLIGTPAIAGAVVTLTLDSAPAAGSDVTVSYAKPAGETDGKLRSAGTMAEVESFGPEAVVFNSAPTAADGTVTTTEDTDYAFAVADFGYADPDSDALASVTVESLPAEGTGLVKLDGAAIPATDLPKTVTTTELGDGKLVYTPPENANGAALASFTFKVNDGTVSSAAAWTLTIDVTAVNDVATGAPAITVPNAYRVPAVLTADLSGIADADGVTNIAASVTYDWQRFDAAGTTLEADAIGTGATYTLAAADVGKKLKVVVRFDDDAGSTETVTSAAAPASGTVAEAADCAAPTLVGGAALVGAGRTLTLGRETVGGTDWHGFSADAGALDARGFTIGTDTYTIAHLRVSAAGALSVQLDRDLAAAHKGTLSLHVCDTALAFGAASGPGADHAYAWAASGLDWSDQAVRTVRLSRDTVAPTVNDAAVNGSSLVITFSEALGAAASLPPPPNRIHGEAHARGRPGADGDRDGHARHRRGDGHVDARRGGRGHRRRDGELQRVDLGQRRQARRPVRQRGV